MQGIVQHFEVAGSDCGAGQRGRRLAAVPPRRANSPGSSAAATPSGPATGPRRRRTGYLTVASDGGIFAFGQDFCGSTGSIALNKPVVGMAAVAGPGGYWLVASDGGVFTYGDAGFFGSTGSLHLNVPVVGMAATPDGKGYWLVASDGGIFTYGDAQFYGSAAATPDQDIVGMAARPTAAAIGR